MDDPFARLDGHAGDPVRGRCDLGRFIDAYRACRGRDFDWDRPAAHLLLGIFGNSPALAERLIANPDWADAHTADAYADKLKPREVFDRELAAALPEPDAVTLAPAGAALRRFKYREMIRIAARDIADRTPTEDILAEWSTCADALVDAAYRHIQFRLDRLHGKARPGCIVALGKLGGRELNYSSDIDILVLYESDAPHPRGGCPLTPHEYHVRLATALTELLGAITPQGFVFRVDHDLRPEGLQGTLANSIDAAERYYEYFGHDWERQALIRARPVAGERAVGETFIERVRPFVFRRSLTMSDLGSMRRLKECAAVACTPEGHFDIKHGNGGIRSVEFLVQALQLLYGGTIPRLREANTFRALCLLADEGFVHPASRKRLLESYAFLRRCENMLQIAHDRQVHVIPADPQELDALARRLGFNNTSRDERLARMKATLDGHRAQTHRLFDALFREDYERTELVEAIEANLRTCANEEEEHESIPWFKNQEVRRIRHLDLERRIPLKDVLARISLVADVVISYAYSFALRRLIARYGTPRDEHGNPAYFAVLGMGRLGSCELDYASDLDVGFIYSENGATDGAHTITNSEFFTRLAQRIISIISTRSRFGRAYEVDSELRPSGNAGSLVSSESAFINYHVSCSPPWERLAMLRARVIDGQEPFTSRLRLVLDNIAFETPPPPKMALYEEMRQLRKRVHQEILKEGRGSFDVKRGPGGSDDVDAIIRSHQLLHAGRIPSLRLRNTFEILAVLAQHELIGPAMHADIAHALHLHRMVLSRIRLMAGRRFDIFDPSSPHAADVAELAGFETAGQLAGEIERVRTVVQDIYEETTS